MKIEKLDHYGRGITRVNDKICFVENAITDEEVEINIIKDKKNYQEATVSNYIKKSKNREEVKCKYYDICGGCQISHLNKKIQDKFKQDKVQEIINKYVNSNIKVEEVISDNNYNYRNKVTLHVEGNKLGFYKNKTNEIIDIDECLLLENKINDLIIILKEVIKQENNITKITIKLGNITEEIMLIIEGNINNYNDLIDKVDVLIINDKVITKKDYINSIIGNKKYKVSKDSFFQVNKVITEKIYNEVRNQIIKNKSKNILDLYCGTGTIGIYVADVVNKVIGIEVVESAIKDAKYNKKVNNVDNVSFIQGKVENEIDSIKENIDTVILDPPRNGLHKNVIKVLKKINPKTIIYVSCDPMTMARDINELKTNYELNLIKPFDMFPNTYHVECISILHRRDINKFKEK